MSRRVVYTTIGGLILKATHPSLRGPNWQLNMQVVDVLNSSPKSIHEGLDTLKKTIKKNQLPVSQVLALILLDAIVSNCPMARSRVGTPDYLRTIKKLSLNRKTDPRVRKQALKNIQSWGRAYSVRRDLYFATTYHKLSLRGVVFPAASSRKSAPRMRKKEVHVHHHHESPPPSSSSSAKSTPPGPPKPSKNAGSGRKIKPEKLRRELDAVENSITLFSQLIAAVEDPTKDDVRSNTLLQEIHQSCKSMHPKMVDLLQNSTIDDESLMSRLLAANDAITKSLGDYDLLMKGIKPAPRGDFPAAYRATYASSESNSSSESSEQEEGLSRGTPGGVPSGWADEFDFTSAAPTHYTPTLSAPPAGSTTATTATTTSPSPGVPIQTAFADLSLASNQSAPTHTPGVGGAPMKMMNVGAMSPDDFARFASRGFSQAGGDASAPPLSPSSNPFAVAPAPSSTPSPSSMSSPAGAPAYTTSSISPTPLGANTFFTGAGASTPSAIRHPITTSPGTTGIPPSTNGNGFTAASAGPGAGGAFFTGAGAPTATPPTFVPTSASPGYPAMGGAFPSATMPTASAPHPTLVASGAPNPFGQSLAGGVTQSHDSFFPSGPTPLTAATNGNGVTRGVGVPPAASSTSPSYPSSVPTLSIATPSTTSTGPLSPFGNPYETAPFATSTTTTTTTTTASSAYATTSPGHAGVTPPTSTVADNAFSEFNIFSLLNPEQPTQKKRSPSLNEQRQAASKPLDDLFA